MNNRNNASSAQSLARQLALECIVLLENRDGCLPLRSGQTVALFGRTQNDTVIGGSGSGASDSHSALQTAHELENAGLILQPQVKEYYSAVRRTELEASGELKIDFPGLVASGLIYEIFGRYHPPVDEPVPDEAIFKKAAAQTDTAILVIGRASGGEECDRHVNNDYYLTPSERRLAELTAAYFSKVIVIYNVNGAVDTAWMREYPSIKAAVFMGTCGEQAAGALADILVGMVSPSGKLAQTFALSYEDYPTAGHFSFDKSENGRIKTYADYGLEPGGDGAQFEMRPVTVYAEDIYVGYRYFESFGVGTAYPFGHGLSYADFDINCTCASVCGEDICLDIDVRNIGKEYAGKEVVQVYISVPCAKLEQPARQLKAFAKTSLVRPGESEKISLRIPLRDVASFDEDICGYIIESGIYGIYIGNSVSNSRLAAQLTIAHTQTISKLGADIGPEERHRGKLSFLSRQGCSETAADVAQLVFDGLISSLPQQSAERLDFSVEPKTSTLSQVSSGEVTMAEFVNQLSVPELAVLLCGYGPGLPFGGIGQSLPGTIFYEDGSPIGTNSHPCASPGYENPAMAKYGIYSAWYKDGPASVGKTSWPTGMMLACSFNESLLYSFGAACAQEAEQSGVDCWLAPGLNLIRNPIEGRAFEYFSEDPFLCGKCGTAIVRGAVENNRITACPKHFALNEQETYRRGSSKKKIDAVDTIASARAARELYLEPFRMVITQAKPLAIMTSFNRVNGTFAAGNSVLCRDILRDEWGFDGVVVTDWGDMDCVVDGADAVAAGNDVIMPGGPPVISQILKGYEDGRVTLSELRTAAAHLLSFVMKTKSQENAAGASL